jgi:hypothetical protein
VISVHALGPVLRDRLGFQVGTDPQDQVDVRPPVLSVGRCGTHEGGRRDAFVFACRPDEAIADAFALSRGEHLPSVARGTVLRHRDRRR